MANLILSFLQIVLLIEQCFGHTHLADTPRPHYNILIVPCPIGASHIKTFLPLAEYLTQKGGHNVTMFSSFYDQSQPITNEHVTMINLQIWTANQDLMDQFVHGNASDDALGAWEMTDTKNYQLMPLYDISNDICRNTISQHADVMRSILHTSWDVIITDTAMAHCSYVISNSLSAQDPTSAVRILFALDNPLSYNQRHLGIPAPISDPYAWQGEFDHKLFLKRLNHGFWFHIVDYWFSSVITYGIQTALFGGDLGNTIPDSQLGRISEQQFSLCDFDRSTSFSFHGYPNDFGVYRPYIQTEMGGLGFTCPKITQFQNFADFNWPFVHNSSSKGTVLLALGHYVNWDEIPDRIVMAFYSAFTDYPDYRFIWQYNGNRSLPSRLSLVNTDNILLLDWIPQIALLQDSNTRLLISQLGSKSTMETICATVPILALPTWGEQAATARLLTNHHRAGIFLKRSLITKNYLKTVIGEVLAKQTFHKNQLARLLSLIRDKPISSDDLALFWIEYSVRHRCQMPILTIRGRWMNFVDYFCLDVIIVLLFISFSFIRMSICILTKIYGLVMTV